MKKTSAWFHLLPTVALLAAPASCGGGSEGAADAAGPDADASSDGAAAGGEVDAGGLPQRTVDLVNPFIGTGGLAWGVGSGFPGPKAPFGMIAPSPDTSLDGSTPGFSHCGGYHADDNLITGFSHTHLYGVGIPAQGDILFMPERGTMAADLARPEVYRSPFDKASEEASPGYYAVTLDDPSVRAELTATERAAHHRWRWLDEPAGSAEDRAIVVIDLGHTAPEGRVTAAELTVDPQAGTVEGWAHDVGGFTSRYGGLRVYFSARFDAPIAAYATFRGEALSPDVPQRSADDGTRIGALLDFGPAAGAAVEAQTGISFISVESARANREAELPAWDFDGTRAATADAWEEAMSAVSFEGGTDAQRVIMATALYHVMMTPDLFMDVDRQYLGFDDQVHTAEGFDYYTTFSLWDTYRTEHPLLALVAPERQRDMVESLLTMAEQSGCIPKWAMGKGDSGSMIGMPGEIVIAETYLKGITDFDAELALSEMLELARGPMDGQPWQSCGRGAIASYAKWGYVAADEASGSVARTMEYAVADHAIARFAEAMGDADAAAELELRSRSYRNVWNAESGFFRGRNADGSWVPGFDETYWEGYYTEGNARQYLWLAPQDIGGLVELLGGPETVATRLIAFFEGAREELAARDPDDLMDHLVPPAWYWHGNEPDIHAAYLFLGARRPELAQEWSRWVADTLYRTDARGLAGNDDCGTLSAWYVFTAMGLYPIAGDDWYLIGSPIFDRLEVRVAGGTLVIEAPRDDPSEIYVAGVTLNGQPLDAPRIDHASLAAGGTLHFTMAAEPQDWGSAGIDGGM